MKKIDQKAHYFETNDWARKDIDGITLGITDFAQTVFGEVIFVECIKIGTIVKKGELIATIESNKATTDILSPLSGKIIMINDSLIGQPNLTNSNPYKDGWLVKIETVNEMEWNELMNADDYKKYMSVFYNKL